MLCVVCIEPLNLDKNMDNISLQSDEIEALKSIYEDQWVIENIPNTYSIEINKNIKLYVTLSPDYPTTSPPTYELLAPTLKADQKQKISHEFQTIYEENKGDPIIFQWVEFIKDLSFSEEKEEQTESNNDSIKDSSEKIIVTNLKNITTGNTIIDRKSVFQGHACIVDSQEDVNTFLGLLLENKKIAQATHNISAYRIKLKSNSILQDCDDDGEAHAGGRLLHLLQILNVENVMVVVTRWYGGIHLGPDRFKHINNAARQVLLQGGFLKSEEIHS